MTDPLNGSRKRKLEDRSSSDPEEVDRTDQPIPESNDVQRARLASTAPALDQEDKLKLLVTALAKASAHTNEFIAKAKKVGAYLNKPQAADEQRKRALSHCEALIQRLQEASQVAQEGARELSLMLEELQPEDEEQAPGSSSSSSSDAESGNKRRKVGGDSANEHVFESRRRE